jgi:hypothetical protein
MDAFASNADRRAGANVGRRQIGSRPMEGAAMEPLLDRRLSLYAESNSSETFGINRGRRAP